MAALGNIDSPQRGVVLLDAQHRVMFANARACEIFRAPLCELVGAELPQVITRRPSADEQIIEEVIEQSLSPGTVVHRYSTPVYDSENRIAGRVEIYSDITARRELEREILDRNRELADLNRLLEDAQEQLLHSERLRTLGEMAAGVAHDINNSLGIILGNAQLIRRKAGENEGVMKSVEAIELGARDAAETIRRLREIGKPPDTSGYREVDLGEVAGDVIQAVVPAWQESSGSGVAISVETDLSPECVILGNATEIREALANLLLNAAQAMESDGRIRVVAQCNGDYAELTVEDTGVGMDEETRERLFDPFFTTRGAEGTGLGMSMVDATAIRHGGRVIVESRQGSGTRVTMRFPTR